MTKKLLVVGSSNTDLSIVLERLPRPGETLLGSALHQAQGGKGANQAVAAARAGIRVEFVGAHGADAMGEEARRRLAGEGVGTRFFFRLAGHPSGAALILLGGKDRQNMIAVGQGANNALSPALVRRARPVFKTAAAVLCQLETPLPAIAEAAAMAQKAGRPFLLNAAPARHLPSSLMKKVSVLLVNESEAELMSKKAGPAPAARKLLTMGPKTVVLTLGSKGVLLADARGLRSHAAQRVKAVDTVGAGDCFTGWLAAGMIQGLDMDASVRRAIRAAAISVTRRGAMDSMPRLRDLA